MRFTTRLLALAGSLIASGSASSTEYVKQTTLTWLNVQAVRPAQTWSQNRRLISFASGSVWSVNGGSGGGACNEAAAVLPDDDSFLQAVALTAIASGAVVEVAVDSTLPMLGVYCQVSMLSIKAN